MKQIQVSFQFLTETYRLIQRLDLSELDEETANIAKKLETEAKEKIDKMVKRELYSTYKTADTEQEREKARKEYLDKSGISQEWRW